MLAYTDGIMEARVEDGRLLGSDGLLKLVQSLHAQHPEQIIPNLVSALESRLHSAIDDDFTLLLARCNARSVSLMSDLLAPFRLLTSPRNNTQYRDPAAIN